jgi:hypothetical protein
LRKKILYPGEKYFFAATIKHCFVLSMMLHFEDIIKI